MSASIANSTGQSDCWDDWDFDSPLNWNFDSVPNDEIIGCCLWEYARESETITMMADLRWCHTRRVQHRQDYERDPNLRKEHDAEATRIEERAKRKGFDYESFSERFWETDYPLMEIYWTVTSMVSDWAFAWQQLPNQIRAKLSNEVAESRVLQPLTAATVRELEELWKTNSVQLAAVRLREGAANDDGEDAAALWAETEAVELLPMGDGVLKDRLTVAFTVDFSRFTDHEISDDFLAWLKQNRPPQWKIPRRIFPGARQKGRKLIEYRVAIERLGLMRLLHVHSPTSLREQVPQAWKKYRAKERSFRREIREGCKFFRRLFPFLPEQERPRSEERFGIWFPPVRRCMDEMDREMGIIRGRK
jgi:hypothetical protein